MHNQNPWAKFSRGYFTFLFHVSFMEEKMSKFTIATAKNGAY